MYRNIILASVLSLNLVGTASAADCNDEHTVDTCLNAVAAEIASNGPKFEVLAANTVIEQERALSITTTGDVALNAFGSEVSLNDFLNLFNIAVDPGTGSDNSEQISLEYSPTKGWLSGDFKLGLATTRPTLPERIKTTINDSTLVDSLENEFTVADDVTMSLGYSYMGHLGGILFGRSARDHQDLLNAVVYEAKKKTDRDASARLFLIGLQNNLKKTYGVSPTESFGKARTSIKKSILNTAAAINPQDIRVLLARLTSNFDLAPVHQTCRETLKEFDFDDMEASSARAADCIVDNFVRITVDESQAEIDSVTRFRQELVDKGFFKISGLINNQSQLILSAKARNRVDLAGGDEYSLKVSMEWDMSGHNVSNLLEYLNKECWSTHVTNPTLQDYQSCSDSISNYVAENPVKTGGWRASASLEYSKSDALDLSFPGSAASFQADKAKSLLFSLVAGRQYDLLSQAGLPKAKLDIGASYADVSSDPMRQDRAMANITFTQELAQATQLSIGLVWANKGEYRGEADSDLSARLGLNYKFGPTKAKDQ